MCSYSKRFLPSRQLKFVLYKKISKKKETDFVILNPETILTNILFYSGQTLPKIDS